MVKFGAAVGGTYFWLPQLLGSLLVETIGVRGIRHIYRAFFILLFPASRSFGLHDLVAQSGGAVGMFSD